MPGAHPEVSIHCTDPCRAGLQSTPRPALAGAHTVSELLRRAVRAVGIDSGTGCSGSGGTQKFWLQRREGRASPGCRERSCPRPRVELSRRGKGRAGLPARAGESDGGRALPGESAADRVRRDRQRDSERRAAGCPRFPDPAPDFGSSGPSKSEPGFRPGLQSPRNGTSGGTSDLQIP